jgi:hypothetical protein
VQAQIRVKQSVTKEITQEAVQQVDFINLSFGNGSIKEKKDRLSLLKS